MNRAEVTSPRPRQARAVGLRDLGRLVALKRDAERREEFFRAPRLTYLFWEATRRCNLRCAHCGSACEAQSPHPELTVDQVKEILDGIAEDFEPRRIFTSITGGEPLLRPDLFEVVAHLTRLGMRSSIVTNGTLLGRREAERLAAAGMRTATVSVDGLEPEHAAVRGPGTFAPALAALGHARAAGFRVVEAITCARPANLDGLVELEGRLREAGADRWRLLTIDRMGRGADDASLWLGPPALRRLLDFVEERRAHHLRAGDGFDVRFSCGGFLGVRRERAVRPGDGQCFAGLSVGSILCDGQVGACPSMPPSWAQGSALEERFSILWRTRFQKYRDLSWRREGICADCSWFGLCKGGGLHERLVQPEEFCWLDRQDG